MGAASKSGHVWTSAEPCNRTGHGADEGGRRGGACGVVPDSCHAEIDEMTAKAILKQAKGEK